MYTNKIRLRDVSEVHEFIKLADTCDFDVNIGYDRVVIDAKSIVGVMGLNLSRVLTVSFGGESDALKRFCDAHQ